MHVHLPKPLHGWRQFFGEIGIIVLGVLIALGAEQLVEAIHERALRHEARTAIDGELGQDLDGFRRRGAVQACIDARLDALEMLLAATPPGARLPRPLWIGRPQVWAVATNVWEATTSGARTALLSFEQQHRYAQIYSLLRVFDQAEDLEQLAWARLRVLEIAPRLDPPTRLAMLEALQQARYANFRILVAAAETRELAASAGLHARRTRYGPGSRSPCIALATPRETALAMIAAGRTLRFEP